MIVSAYTGCDVVGGAYSGWDVVGGDVLGCEVVGATYVGSASCCSAGVHGAGSTSGGTVRAAAAGTTVPTAVSTGSPWLSRRARSSRRVSVCSGTDPSADPSNWGVSTWGASDRFAACGATFSTGAAAGTGSTGAWADQSVGGGGVTGAGGRCWVW